MIVPVRYEADGSGRLPDTSSAAMDELRAQILAMYPIAPDQLRMRIRDPMPFDYVITREGAGFELLLETTRQLRLSDSVPPETYYFSLVSPAPSYSQYCGGGMRGGSPPHHAQSKFVTRKFWVFGIPEKAVV